MLEVFPIPDDFRAFMRSVAEHLDRPDDEKFLDTEDAFQHECGHGGRTFGGTTNYNFTYLSPDGQHRWELSLREQQIRDIADGTITEVEGVRDDIDVASGRSTRRTARGFPLCVWGEFRADALRIRAPHELTDALDTLHAAAAEEPVMLRLWSAGDDQVIAIVWREDCALYVVESSEGYGTSEGNPARKGGFEAKDHEGAQLTVAWADCVEWSVARRALIQFADKGDCGGEVALSGSIPTGFLMMGDFDRASVIAVRGEPPAELRATSLPGMVPKPALDLHAEWAAKVMDALAAHALITVDDRAREQVMESFTNLVRSYGDEAVERTDTADWLANELSMIRGVEQLVATGGDLQIALRRSR